MRTLLQLFIRNGGFVTFVLAEVFCFYIIVQYNDRQDAIFSHTSAVIGGNLLEKRQKVVDYFDLQERIDSLLKINSVLQNDLANARSVQIPLRDTFFRVLYDTISRVDSIRHKAIRPEYRFVLGTVVGNSLSSVNNWLILNRGRIDGVRPDMAVVTPKGIVGIVRHVDAHFSIAMSVLHRQTKVSASLPQHNDAFGSLVWDGGDPTVMTLKYIPKHIVVKPGETVVTSGLSQMFPKGVPVGLVSDEQKIDPENPYFTMMHVRLSQDMSVVKEVNIVENLYKNELDSLKLKIKGMQ